MDPNANLEEQLERAREIVRRNDDEEVITYGGLEGYEAGVSSHDKPDVVELAELVVALDEWIRGGGFLPVPWRKKGG